MIDVLVHLDALKPESFKQPIHSRSDWTDAAAYWRGEDKFDHEGVRKRFERWLHDGGSIIVD